MQVPEIDDTDVSPEHDWYEPPRCVWLGPNPTNPGQWELMLMPDHMYACGGESYERGEREAYRLMHPSVDLGLPGMHTHEDVPCLMCLCSGANNTAVWWDAWLCNHLALKLPMWHVTSVGAEH